MGGGLRAKETHMPRGIVAIEHLNVMFSTRAGDPERVLGVLQEANTLPEVYERLEIQEIAGAANAELRTVFGAIPAGLQSAIIASSRSAVERGLGVTFAWKPSIAFELGMWEAVDEDGAGGLTLLISTPPGRSL
jgi:hypothetical protein